MREVYPSLLDIIIIFSIPGLVTSIIVAFLILYTRTITRPRKEMQNNPSSRNVVERQENGEKLLPCILADILTHHCGYSVYLHLVVFHSQHGHAFTDILNSWKSLEIIYTDGHGEKITYCPGCGETFTVQGRIEKG